MKLDNIDLASVFINLKEKIWHYRWWVLLGIVWMLISFLGQSVIGGIGSYDDSVDSLFGMPSPSPFWSSIVIYSKSINLITIILYLPAYITYALTILLTGNQVNYSVYNIFIAILIPVISIMLALLFGYVHKKYLFKIIKTPTYWKNLRPRTKGALLGVIWSLFIMLFNMIPVANAYYLQGIKLFISSLSMVFLFPWIFILQGYIVLFPAVLIWILYGYLIGLVYEKKVNKK